MARNSSSKCFHAVNPRNHSESFPFFTVWSNQFQSIMSGAVMGSFSTGSLGINPHCGLATVHKLGDSLLVNIIQFRPSSS